MPPPSNTPTSYVPLTTLQHSTTSPSHSPINDPEDPLLYAAFSDAEDDFRGTNPHRPPGHHFQPFNIITSSSEPLSANSGLEDDDGVDAVGGIAVVSLLGGGTSRGRFGGKRGPEHLPEQDFLNLLLHQPNLDDAQELCRARIDHLMQTDDARKMQRHAEARNI